ncbi:MAG: adenylate/guanylate cyclase domain-containing protein [Bacteroidota bacterium]
MSRRTITRINERGIYGALVAFVYGVLNLNGRIDWILISTLTGFCLGFCTGLLDYWLFHTRLRRQPFLVVLAVRTVAYLGMVCFILLLILGIFLIISTGQSPLELWHSTLVQNWIAEGSFGYLVLYCMVVLLILQFVTLVARLLGPNVLLNYLMGRYHEPKEEERIFMFMDLRSSTTIAERLGHLEWHNFLNDFFFDIAQPVRRYRGEIYQYVGDEVVISWPKETGLRRLNCIHCFFGIWRRIASRKESYLKKYGYEPVFKAGYHVGEVTVGEIGDYKRDVVFHGDVVNTASRIQVECNHYNRRLLLSNTLLDQLDLGDEFTSEYITRLRLRGKNEELELHSLDPVEEAALQPAVR